MLYRYPYLFCLSLVSISLILESGCSIGNVWSAALSIHWHVVFFDEPAVLIKESLILVSLALSSDSSG